MRDSGAALKYGIARVQGTTATRYQEPPAELLSYEAAATLGDSMCTAHNAVNTLLCMTPAESLAVAKFLHIELVRYQARSEVTGGKSAH